MATIDQMFDDLKVNFTEIVKSHKHQAAILRGHISRLIKETDMPKRPRYRGFHPQPPVHRCENCRFTRFLTYRITQAPCEHEPPPVGLVAHVDVAVGRKGTCGYWEPQG